MIIIRMILLQGVKLMKFEDIKDIDICYSFFHYTNKNNIESIAKKRIASKIGDRCN